jgi:hypothetical protein
MDQNTHRYGRGYELCIPDWAEKALQGLAEADFKRDPEYQKVNDNCSIRIAELLRLATGISFGRPIIPADLATQLEKSGLVWRINHYPKVKP